MRIFKYLLFTIIMIIIGFSVVEMYANTPRAVLNNLISEGRLSSSSLKLRLDYLSIVPTGEATFNNLGEEKFKNEELAQLLIDTDGHELIEGNWWRDFYWGVCNGKGENHLGKLIMAIRTILLKSESN